MKKILLILLAFSSLVSFAQAEFPEGIALSGNTPSVSTSKIVTQEPATGNLNYIDAVSLPLSTEANLELIKKQFLSTGLLQNGLISINGDPTKFNITAGVGIISNFDNPGAPTSTVIPFGPFTGITPTYLTTGNITYVAINSTPSVVMQATPFTPEQRRSLIVLGATIHSNLTTINVLNNISAPTNADTNQLHDFMEAVGALNITGNKYTANGANLQLNKSAGVLFKLGSNFAVDWKNPHEIAQSGGTAITFRYRTQNGTESADMTSISPGLYDLNNVLTTVPNNKFTIQTVTVFQTGLTRIQWGQTIYDDLQSAKNALLTRDFVVENNIKENGVTRAYIIVRNSTTSLQNVSDAYISEAQKFGGVASGGVALTLANIVTALGYTPENVANKSDSYTSSSSTTYSSTKALVDGLATKQNTLTNPITGTGTTNTIPKWTGTTTQGNSNFSDNGTLTASSTDMTINGFRFGRGLGNISTNIGIGGGNYDATITGTLNVALGVSALNRSLGFGNMAIGGEALYWSTTGSFNTGIGLSAGMFIADGVTANAITNNSVFIGRGTKALANSQTNQVVIGDNAIGLGSNTTVIGNSSTLRYRIWGNGLFGTSTDNGQGVIQANGNITASPATLSNQVVVKSQLDLKADLASPTFTGVPSVPTATAGTNTTQIASTAFVVSNSNANGVLEFNATDRTVWNNGKGNEVTNTSYGELSLSSNVSGSNNTSIGYQSLNSLNSGTQNTSLGYASLQSITSGSYNVGNGYASLNGINSGVYNVADGYDSGRYIADGITSLTSSNNSLFLGARTKALINSSSNEIVIGYESIGSGSNTVTLGNTSISKTILRGVIQQTGYTVATLPTGSQGMFTYVTDALAPSYMVTIVGGGTVVTPVFFNGTNWVAH